MWITGRYEVAAAIMLMVSVTSGVTMAWIDHRVRGHNAILGVVCGAILSVPIYTLIGLTVWLYF